MFFVSEVFTGFDSRNYIKKPINSILTLIYRKPPAHGKLFALIGAWRLRNDFVSKIRMDYCSYRHFCVLIFLSTHKLVEIFTFAQSKHIKDIGDWHTDSG